MGVDFDEHVFSGVDVDLKSTGLVKRRVEKCQEALGGSVQR
jgi:hypothetical protein